MNIFSFDEQYVASTYGRQKVHFVSGKGSFLYDENGKEYIDFGTGIAVNGLGVKFQPWLDAVKAQLDLLPHASNLYYTSPCALLAEKICSRTGMKKVFFANSGAEANECAIKVARKYSFDKYGSGREKIVALKNSFHGRTITTLAATGQDAFHKYFMPFTEGFVFGEPTFESVKKFADEHTAAVMLETVQGEGGVNALGGEFLTKIAAFCKENDILLIIDEVQTGNGRTGKLYSFQNYGIIPDIFTTAKGLGNGLPIGAAVFGEKTASVLGKGDHGSTFGGNPVACAGACAVLDAIDDDLLAGVAERSKYITDFLSALPSVKSVTGLGLMLGIETYDAAAKVAACLEKGLVVLTAKNKIRLLPALNIPYDILKKGLEVLKEVLA